MPWHVNNHLVDRRLLARSLEERRLLASTVLRVLQGRGLLVFSAPDDHIHLLLQGDREAAGQALRAVEIALSKQLRLPVPFATPYFVEAAGLYAVERRLLYVLEQGRHHRVSCDPLQESSSLPDLLGLRVTGAWTLPQVRAEAPRLRREPLLEALGVRDLEGPASPEHLLEAAASAVAEARAEGASERMRQARAAAWRVGRDLGIEPAALAERLGVSLRTGQRMETQSCSPQLLDAVRRQLAARGRLPAPTSFAA